MGAALPLTVTVMPPAVFGQGASVMIVAVPKPIPNTLANAPAEIRGLKLAALVTPLELIVGRVGVRARITEFCVSATYSLPAESMVTPRGNENPAFVATPPSPE